jgi:hypothetical protein
MCTWYGLRSRCRTIADSSACRQNDGGSKNVGPTRAEREGGSGPDRDERLNVQKFRRATCDIRHEVHDSFGPSPRRIKVRVVVDQRPNGQGGSHFPPKTP